MNPYYEHGGITVHLGDSRDIVPALGAFDACVTDPPYELGFMGRKWDASGIAYDVTLWRKVFDALKPGAHLLAFGGTRTYHRMTCAIEDAGFEIRDCIQWIYGSGFPKSLDVSKAIDKAAGAEREVIGRTVDRWTGRGTVLNFATDRPQSEIPVTGAPASDAAKQWDGWGTALKPANEPIVLARKPLIGTVAANVLQHGTGALNIDGSRVGTTDSLGGGDPSAKTKTKPEGWDRPWMQNEGAKAAHAERVNANVAKAEALGRWPANVIHDGSAEVLSAFPDAPGQMADAKVDPEDRKTGRVYGAMKRGHEPSANSDNVGVVGFKMKPGGRRLDDGSAARFFYCAKASKDDRGEGNTHATVKPVTLMRYLCRLVTPPGGRILDPFAGSGTTLVAARLEGFNAAGVDLEERHVDIICQRICGIEQEALAL